MKKILKNLFITMFFVCFFVFCASAEAKIPQDYQGLKKLGDDYCKKEDLSSALIYYKQAYKINPNKDDLNKLGLIYFLNKDLSNALACFEVSFKMYPDKRTKTKIDYINFLIEREKKNNKINIMEPKEHAPQKLHDLVKVEGKLDDPEDLNRLHKIIDFLWSDKEGKALLQKIVNTNLNIHLKKNISYSCMGHSKFNEERHTIIGNHNLDYLAAFYMAKILYIKESDISDFQKKGNIYEQNKWAITVLAHELCHLSSFITYPASEDSKEEELIATIIGDNIASRILTGEPSTKEQVKELATRYYNVLFLNHKCIYFDLQMEENAAQRLIPMGVTLPYYSVYADLESLKLMDESNNPAVQNYINSLNTIILENYETIYSNKSVCSSYVVYINKDKIMKVVKAKIKSTSKYGLAESMFNLNIAVLTVPMPENYNQVFIPLSLERVNKQIKVNYALR